MERKQHRSQLQDKSAGNVKKKKKSVCLNKKKMRRKIKFKI